MTQPNPTAARRRLAILLNDARERHGRSLDELAGFLGVSGPQASRLDSGARGFRPEDVSRLADWYGFDAARTHGLLALADESRRRVWWQQVDLDPSYRTLIGMEQAALSIDEYGASVIPGLLQTRDYARVTASVGDVLIGTEVSEDLIEQAVDTRLRRQQLRDDRRAKLTVVIDESVLARGPRDRAVRLAQLAHLREAADRPGVTVQVIGFDYGLYTATTGQFILLTMDEGLPDFFYSHGVRGGFESSDVDTLRRHRLIWNELRAKALDIFASKNLIDRYIRELAQ